MSGAMMAIMNNVRLPQPVTSGLVYYIDAGNVSSYSGTGSSINNIAGTAPGASTINNSPAFTSAGQSSYFTFNGSTQYILTDNLIGQSLSSNVTIECWVNTSADNGVVVTEQGILPVNSGWHDSQIEIVSGNLEVATWEYTTIHSDPKCHYYHGLYQWFHNSISCPCKNFQCCCIVLWHYVDRFGHQPRRWQLPCWQLGSIQSV